MFEDLSDQELEKLMAEASERMVFGKGEIAYSSAAQYIILRSEQEERQRKKYKGEKHRTFAFELPNY